MKKFLLFCSLLLLFFYHSYSQSLIIKGRVKCINTGVSSTKGAEHIIIVPTFLPSKSTITNTRPSGYFEFNTGMPLSRLQDKQINLYTVSRCSNCKEIVRRVFISEDQDRQNKDDARSYVTVKDWTLNASCSVAELRPVSADSLLAVIARQPGQDLDKVSSSSALLGTPAFLNFLTNVISVAGVLPVNAGEFNLSRLGEGQIRYGELLFGSATTNTANTGFSFSPYRDMSEAVFWNPSAIAFSKKAGNISLLTNLKNNFKLSGFTAVNSKLSVGIGAIYTRQDELRSADFASGGNTTRSDSLVMKLKEYAAFVSSSYKVNRQFSLGLSVKSIWQDFNVPYRLSFITPVRGRFTDTAIKRQHIDVDVSALYKLSPSFQIGINAMNLAGSELYEDAFVPAQPASFLNQRSLGVGFCYKNKRWNVGADFLLTQDDFYDASIGVNYVPFNNALLSAGIAVKQLGYSFAFRMKHFRIAYVNNNEFFVNETKKGKSGMLNGSIYGGFVFDLD